MIVLRETEGFLHSLGGREGRGGAPVGGPGLVPNRSFLTAVTRLEEGDNSHVLIFMKLHK